MASINYASYYASNPIVVKPGGGVYIGSQPFTSVQAAIEFIDILRSAEDTTDYNASNASKEIR
jgi:hypothetical protein